MHALDRVFEFVGFNFRHASRISSARGGGYAMGQLTDSAAWTSRIAI
jgi:hypothetical protein